MYGSALTTLRPCAYVDGPVPDDATARHLLAVRAALPRPAGDTVLSHASAAVVHGLPLWAVPLDRVHATRDRTSGARRSGILQLHAAALEPDEVVLVDGKVKYGRYLRPGQTPGDAVFAEKRREDALRDYGLEVVRWVWDEKQLPLRRPRELCEDVRRGRSLAGRTGARQRRAHACAVATMISVQVSSGTRVLSRTRW